MKANFHTHSSWCDGRGTPEEMVRAAIAKGFSAIGFSSHAMLPGDPLDWPLTRARLPLYAAEIRRLARKAAGEIEVLCGVEADYIPGLCSPDRSMYEDSLAAAGGGAADGETRLDYVIGSIHFLRAPDGSIANVDKSPESFSEDVEKLYGGSAEAFVRAYFAAQRDMVARFDFDVLAHPDLVRKFNRRLGFLDETAPWYIEELERTADAIAASGKIVEVNTGAISRGWMDDAYPSAAFRAMLRDRGVRFILSADAHSPEAIDCAFDRFGPQEDYLARPRPALPQP